MNIARAGHLGDTVWGFVHDGAFSPADLDGSPLGMSHAQLTAALEGASGAVSIEDVNLLAPIPSPPQFVGIGLNYRDHAAEAGLEPPESPVSFGLLPNAILDPGEPIRIPSFTDHVDWEAELGIVIGAGGRDIALDDAVDHVFGYTVINDVSARDVQFADGQWTRAKSFDTFKPMGPWVTTTSELGDAGDLGIRLSVNGAIKQDSTTSELIFSVPELVSRLSLSMTLLPGMVISTGTPSGVGYARDPREFLRDGDTVTVEIDGIGALTNPVTSQS